MSPAEREAMPLFVEDEGPLRVLTISQPARRNALSCESLDAIGSALPATPPSSTQPIRAVVLRGDPAGGAFSAGFDIGEIGPAELARGLDPIEGAANALEACSVPTIAAIDGAAYGGGWELAMACDVRVARADARFCMPPARLGVVYSHGGLARFLRAARVSTLQRLFICADVITGDEALSLGLVDRSLQAESAEREARRLALRICENAPLAVAGMRETLRALTAPARVDDRADVALRACREAALRSDDLQEGIRAFFEKRPPRFLGR